MVFFIVLARCCARVGERGEDLEPKQRDTGPTKNIHDTSVAQTIGSTQSTNKTARGREEFAQDLASLSLMCTAISPDMQAR